MTKAEREEVWQIINHLANQGLNIVQVKKQEQELIVTLSIPLLSERSR
jgi:hypothetical protein